MTMGQFVTLLSSGFRAHTVGRNGVRGGGVPFTRNACSEKTEC
jgi:hypothetical protein